MIWRTGERDSVSVAVAAAAPGATIEETGDLLTLRDVAPEHVAAVLALAASRGWTPVGRKRTDEVAAMQERIAVLEAKLARLGSARA